ncbi:MAG: hypothetical protein A2Z20_06100 [Bdellovibrionales bacterium RBG_16_40_8]|nr:MAG: hypothetical protein A2Z20_06100 [Bdellovibrionales bacterium RBG_16_40_8]
MSKYLKIFFLAVLFSFIWGAWWGFYRLEKHTPRIKNSSEIRLLARQGLFTPKFIEYYKKTFHTKIVLTEKKTEYEVLREILSNFNSYDIIQINSFIVKSFILENIFLPLELDDISHFKDISIDFKNFDFDSDNKYLLPVSWGLNGFLINTEQISLANESLDEMLSSKAKFSILASPVEIYNIAIKLKPIIKNWIETSQTEELHKELKEIRSRLTILSSDSRKQMQDGSLKLAQMTNGNAAKLISENSSYRFVLPKERATLWINLLSVSRGSRDARLAHSFLNNLLNTKIHRKLIEEAEEASVLESLNASNLPLLQKAEFIRRVPLSRFELFINHDVFEPTWSQALRKEWSEFAY